MNSTGPDIPMATPRGANGAAGGARDRSELPRTVPGLLIVDDEEQVLRLLNEVFRQDGFMVWLAASGQEAAACRAYCTVRPLFGRPFNRDRIAGSP